MEKNKNKIQKTSHGAFTQLRKKTEKEQQAKFFYKKNTQRKFFICSQVEQRFSHDNSTPPLLQAVHCRLRCLCALLSVGRVGHRHVRRTFASFTSPLSFLKYNRWMCLPNPCYAVAKPLRGDFSLYTPQRSPYATLRKETGWKNCRNRDKCLSVIGFV